MNAKQRRLTLRAARRAVGQSISCRTRSGRHLWVKVIDIVTVGGTPMFLVEHRFDYQQQVERARIPLRAVLK